MSPPPKKERRLGRRGTGKSLEENLGEQTTSCKHFLDDAGDKPAVSTAPMASSDVLVKSILDEFASLARLQKQSYTALLNLSAEPHVTERQVCLVVLARQYARDCTVLAHRLNRMAAPFKMP